MRTRALAAIAATLTGGVAVAVLSETAGGVTAAHEYNHILAVAIDGRGTSGDPKAFGSFSAVISGRKLCYGLQVVGITPTAAHIHRGAAGTDGPVVVPLEPTGVKPGPPAVGAGCATLSKALAGELVKHPGQFYVNVHTNEFPNSAARGQLAHPAKG